MLRLKSVISEYLRLIFKFKAFILLSATLLALCAMPLSVANAKTVTLGWSPNDEPDLEGYVVYRNTNSPGPPYSDSDAIPESELADPLHPKATLTGLQEGKEYYVALTAYNTEGVESGFSNDLCVEVVNGIAELCAASSPTTPSTSSVSSGGGGGGSVCFISTASYRPPNNHLLFYILFTLTIIGIASCVYKTKAGKQ